VIVKKTRYLPFNPRILLLGTSLENTSSQIYAEVFTMALFITVTYITIYNYECVRVHKLV
jgi:hypothetical protein